MERCLITGVAGFIGSNLAEKLLRLGYYVVGIDVITDYYLIEQKRANLQLLGQFRNFSFFELDLLTSDISSIIKSVDFIFHFAAQPGVRNSFGKNFIPHLESNVYITQKLLESALLNPVKKIIFASSSSVYGNSKSHSVKEDDPKKPESLYGVSKLMAEHLCRIYFEHFNLPITVLRFFTVFGPRQRPDMAFHRFLTSAIKNEKLIIYGSGNQTRDFTYIDDITNACLLTLKLPYNGDVFNIGSGTSIRINDVIEIVQTVTNTRMAIEYLAKEKADVEHTLSDISRAQKALHYSPQWQLVDGIIAEYQWLKTSFGGN